MNSLPRGKEQVSDTYYAPPNSWSMIPGVSQSGNLHSNPLGPEQMSDLYDSSGSTNRSYAFTTSPLPPPTTDFYSHHSGSSFYGQPTGFESRPTPTSLGWEKDTHLLKLYKFVAAKGKDPYFELLPQWTATYETPATVYLDKPE